MSETNSVEEAPTPRMIRPRHVLIALAVLFAVLAALIPAAILFRRKIKDPETPLGRWFEERFRPLWKDAVIWVSILTLVAWAAVYALAPEGDRGNLSQFLKGFLEQINPKPQPGSTAPAPAPVK